jgi:hypothetical protein
MTQATKVATIEEYMDLVKEGDHDKVVAFINECFGTEEDFDNEACDAFANAAQPVLTTFLEDEIKKMPEATNDMMPAQEAVEATTAEVAVEAPVEVATAANDSAEDAFEAAAGPAAGTTSEAPNES